MVARQAGENLQLAPGVAAHGAEERVVFEDGGLTVEDAVFTAAAAAAAAAAVHDLVDAPREAGDHGELGAGDDRERGLGRRRNQGRVLRVGVEAYLPISLVWVAGMVIAAAAPQREPGPRGLSEEPVGG